MTYDELVNNLRNYTEIDSNVFMMAVLNEEGADLSGGIWGGFLAKCGCSVRERDFLPAELLGKVREAKDKGMLK